MWLTESSSWNIPNKNNPFGVRSSETVPASVTTTSATFELSWRIWSAGSERTNSCCRQAQPPSRMQSNITGLQCLNDFNRSDSFSERSIGADMGAARMKLDARIVVLTRVTSGSKIIEHI